MKKAVTAEKQEAHGPIAHVNNSLLYHFILVFFQIFSRYISNLNIEPLIGLGFSLESQFKYSYNII